MSSRNAFTFEKIFRPVAGIGTGLKAVTDLLEPFADGELALPDQEAVAQHVRGYTECQLHLEELRALSGSSGFRRIGCRAGLASRIADKLADKQESARRTAWSAWSMPVALHLAAALIGLAAGYWIPARRRPVRQLFAGARGRPCLASLWLEAGSTISTATGWRRSCFAAATT